MLVITSHKVNSDLNNFFPRESVTKKVQLYMGHLLVIKSIYFTTNIKRKEQEIKNLMML